MSVATSRVFCSDCDYSTLTCTLWGRFEYELSDGTRIPLDRHLGWCRDCKKLVPIEGISIQEVKDKLDAKEAEVGEVQSELKKTP